MGAQQELSCISEAISEESILNHFIVIIITIYIFMKQFTLGFRACMILHREHIYRESIMEDIILYLQT